MRCSMLPFAAATCREDCDPTTTTPPPTTTVITTTTPASTTTVHATSTSTPASTTTTIVPDTIGQMADLVYLKTFHATFLTARPDGTMKCDRPDNVEWEKFRVIDNGDTTISLLSFHGKFLAAHPDGSVMCDRHEVSDSEKWTYVELDDGRHTLMSHHKKYLSAKGDGTVRADFNDQSHWKSPGMGWESFEVVNDPESLIALKTHHHTYVSAHVDGSISADFDRGGRGDWETFRLVRHGNKMVSLQTAHGHYVALHHDGSVTAEEEFINESDKFELLKKNGYVNIKSAHNKYLSAKSDGALRADFHADGGVHTTGPGGWETFTLETVSKVPAPAPATWEVVGSDVYCNGGELSHQHGNSPSGVLAGKMVCQASCESAPACQFYLYRHDPLATTTYTCATFSACASTHAFEDGEGGHIYRKPQLRRIEDKFATSLLNTDTRIPKSSRHAAVVGFGVAASVSMAIAVAILRVFIYRPSRRMAENSEEEVIAQLLQVRQVEHVEIDTSLA